MIFCYISHTSQKSNIPVKRFGALKSIIDFIYLFIQFESDQNDFSRTEYRL